MGTMISLPLLLESLRSAQDLSPIDPLYFNGTYCLIFLDITFQFFLSGIIFTIFKSPKIYPFGRVFLVSCFMDTMNNIFTPYLSAVSRNSPTIQAITVNSYVPINMIIRFAWLKRLPSVKQFICVIFVMCGLTMCIVFNLDSDYKSIEEMNGSFLKYNLIWTVAFITLSVIFMGEETVLFKPVYRFLCLDQKIESEECPKVVLSETEKPKNSEPEIPDPFYLFFVSATLKFISGVLMFWVDLVPYFGYSKNVEKFKQK
ncbi:hypothetical protein RF11_02007 [Thelohanellus kitauei]|uniref:Uncharacterized protein n=1 Tax=Thelohanellus kitauei TaxID=669202 RepID=A0A0C2MLB5_THEKT|nr:hypothetical protein RF11_02007 [Thelohanellus kitauei]